MMHVTVDGVLFDTDVISDAFPTSRSGWTDGPKRIAALVTPGCSCAFRGSGRPYPILVCPLQDSAIVHSDCVGYSAQTIRVIVGEKGLDFLAVDPGDAPGCWAHVRENGALILSKDALSYSMEQK